MMYFCAQKNRRAMVLQNGTSNGIDYLEVLGMPGCGTQLAVTFLRDPSPLGLTPTNICISGDTALQAVAVAPANDAAPFTLTVTLSGTGDFSPYRFALVAAAGVADPPDGMDPPLSSLGFSFKAGCPSPADCQPNTCCPPPMRLAPDINYLAKDYAGFVQTLQDRLAVLAPGWTESHAADLGVALIETLAYAADHLSYQQDAVATEAYLGTARSRISQRRHARLVDYAIGEGCNARTWVYLETLRDGVGIPKGTQFFVRAAGLPPVIDPLAPGDQRFVRALQNSTQPIFASLSDAALFLEQNQMDFHTWGDLDCCLPAGATAATLRGTLTTLVPGTLLVFEEVLGPLTGNASDSDPAHRWAVRLTEVAYHDYKGRLLVDPLMGVPITRVAWSADDALPFPLCVSATIGTGTAGAVVLGISVARGNIVAADHGTWIVDEPLQAVPATAAAPVAAGGCDCGSRVGAALVAPPVPPLVRYYPQLQHRTLTFSLAYDAGAAASALPIAAADNATAQASLRSDDGRAWSPVPDLFSSGAEDAHFVPEIENDGSVFLRFGDGQYGLAAATGLAFTATYRIGNGRVGNIGRDSLAHLIFAPNQIRTLRNPLQAAGGTDPESMQHIGQYAPFAFQAQKRCVTEADYGQAAAQSSAIRQARGTLRWTGSWYSAFVSVEPVGALTTQLTSDTTRRLDLMRMMGTDLAVEAAVTVGLTVQIRICVAADHFQGDVYAALMQVFITGDQCGGTSGLLNAANFTFGEMVYASPLVAAALAVDGVVTATLTQFGRMDQPNVDGVAQGYLSLGRLEIARCDNDPNHLDHGQFVIHLDGGK